MLKLKLVHVLLTRKNVVDMGYNGMLTGCNNKTFREHKFASLFSE